MGTCLGNAPFSKDIGVVYLHPSKGTHWLCYINENYSDSYGFIRPKKLSKFIIKRNGHCLHSEYKIQRITNKRDSYYASYCLYKSHLTKLIDIDFKSAVLKSFYQKFSEFQMVLRKTTVNNSVKYIPKSEQTRDKDSKRKTIKNNSLPRKQGEGFSQNNKKIIKNIAAGGFSILKGI